MLCLQCTILRQLVRKIDLLSSLWPLRISGTLCMLYMSVVYLCVLPLSSRTARYDVHAMGFRKCWANKVSESGDHMSVCTVFIWSWLNKIWFIATNTMHRVDTEKHVSGTTPHTDYVRSLFDTFWTYIYWSLSSWSVLHRYRRMYFARQYTSHSITRWDELVHRMRLQGTHDVSELAGWSIAYLTYN